MDKYKVIDHPSDMGIEAFGKDLKQLFENSAFGMMDVMFDLSGTKEITLGEVFDVKVSADNIESLLVAWLSELLYIVDSKKVALSIFQISKLTDKELEAKVLGGKIIKFITFIKAATYNQLEIKKEKGSWKSRVVFDV
jgi:SHS2 domain-containing protein